MKNYIRVYEKENDKFILQSTNKYTSESLAISDFQQMIFDSFNNTSMMKLKLYIDNVLNASFETH